MQDWVCTGVTTEPEYVQEVTEDDEPNNTWRIESLARMRSEDNEAVINALRRSQRKVRKASH